jgi:predicted acyltransferase
LILAFFFGVIDVFGLKAWSFPLRVLGMNSIALYALIEMFDWWFVKTLQTHMPKDFFDGDYGIVKMRVLVVVMMWLLAFWMYRQKAFLRI